MSDHSSKNRIIPRDDLPREEGEEREGVTGPLDVPQQETGEDFQTLEDNMAARVTVPMRHQVPDAETTQRQSGQREISEATGHPSAGMPAPARPSVSILRKRIRKFKTLKRGYYSFLLLTFLYVISFALPLLVNSKALIVHYEGEYYFPAFKYYPGTTFGQQDIGAAEAQYRRLADDLAKKDGDWALMPIYTWDQYESDFGVEGTHPLPPSSRHVFGTDDAGRDVFARMAYGFGVSISFALLLTIINYLAGGAIGAVTGYFGGKTDLVSQRIIEVWSNIPVLYMVIILSSIIIPNFMWLVLLLSLFGWIGVSYLMRGEFYREKAKDYVAAAIALGATDGQVVFKHILPNALTPMIATLPFSIIGGIFSLVSLDYLGFGLPPPTPSWGQMVDVGLKNLQHWWLVIVPISALFVTLLLVTFIGEAIREAFDPRVYSRLR